MPEVPVTILGGLPVIADVSFGVDDSPVSGRDYWSEVDAIYWRRRDGSKGKTISQKVWDRAEKADPYFCCVIEQANDYLMQLAAEPCKVCGDSGVEEVYAGHGAVQELPCSACKPKKVTFLV